MSLKQLQQKLNIIILMKWGIYYRAAELDCISLTRWT